MTHHGPPQVGSSCPLRSRSPCGARSHPSIPPCSVLSASHCSALRLPFGLPSLPPCGARLRFGGLSSPNWGQIALRLTQGQDGFAKSRGCPHLSAVHPQLPPPPSPVLPHVDARCGADAHRWSWAVAALGALALAVVGTGALDVAYAGARAEHESAVASVAPLLGAVGRHARDGGGRQRARPAEQLLPTTAVGRRRATGLHH